MKFLALAAGLGMITLTLKGTHREMGAVFAILAGAALLILMLDKLREAADMLQDLAGYAQMDESQTGLILRVLGISFLAEASAQACRDMGEEGIALRVEMGCKLMLVILSAPLLREVAAIILELTA